MTEPVSATHVMLMNLLNTDCLPSIRLAEGERDGIVEKAIMRSIEGEDDKPVLTLNPPKSIKI